MKIPGLRVIPVLVAVLTVGMGFRFIDVVTGASLEQEPVAFDAVRALSQARAATDGDAALEDQTEETVTINLLAGETFTANVEDVGTGSDDGSGDGGGTQLAAADSGADGAQGEDDLWFDPENREMTRTELRLLQDLSDRRASLIEREEALDRREALLDAAEARFEEKLAELSALRDQIAGLMEQHSEEQEARFSSLVRIYETMGPKDAARIFDTLDMDILIQVVTRMKESRTAPIIAEMSPGRANELTVQLADRGQLPSAVVLQ